MSFKRIVLLAGEWDTTPLVYHFLHNHFPVVKAVVEQPVPRRDFLKRRLKKLGWLEVTGQVLFQVLIGKPLAARSKGQVERILQRYKLTNRPIPLNEKVTVSSVNNPDCLEQLRELSPDLVIVHGTRIISKKLLQAIPVPFLNIHAGITPRYRGSHGAYWALYNDDVEHCGVTVHLVDAGIDTGGILAQTGIPLTKKDNFSTYPYLQLAEGLLLLKQVIEKMQAGDDAPRIENELDSALWHHPTLWGYMWKRITKGVK